MNTANMHTITVGSVQVTAICDLQVPWDDRLFIGPSIQPPPSTLYFHYFLLETGAHKILVDTGTGQILGGEGVGPKLAACGLGADDITHILLTHFHVDHIGGLFDQSQGLGFQHAKIIAHSNERDYWLGATPPQFSAASQREQYGFAQSLRPFSQQITWAQAGETLPGIELIHLPGHTPGHSGFRIRSQGQSLFIIGDIFHQPRVQSANPDVGVEFDVDPALAVVTRKTILGTLAASQELIAGIHLEFPAFGRIQRVDNAYIVTPLSAITP